MGTYARRAHKHSSAFSKVWGIFFAVNDRFVTWQQRRQWRARASFFFLAGILFVLLFQYGLGRWMFRCSRF
jgi:hypothetical protein